MGKCRASASVIGSLLGDFFKNKTSNLISVSKQQNKEWVLPGGILPLGLVLPWARLRFLWRLSSGGSGEGPWVPAVRAASGLPSQWVERRCSV